MERRAFQMPLTDQQQIQLDNLGKAWMAAKTQEEKDRLHSQANLIRSQAGLQAGTDYDPVTGAALNTPAPAAPGQTPPTPPTAPAPAQKTTSQTLLEQWMKLMNGTGGIDDATLHQQALDQANKTVGQQTTSLNSLISSLNSQRANALRGIQNGVKDAKQSLEDHTFQNYLNVRQSMANRGLSQSGIADDQNTRLLLARDQDLAGIMRDAALKNAEVNNQYDTLQTQARQQLSQIDAQDLASQYYTTLKNQAGQAGSEQAKAFAEMLKNFLPYDQATVKDQMDYALGQGKLYNEASQNNAQNQIDWAKVDLDKWKALGFIPVGDKLVPTLDANDKNRQAALDEAKARGYFVNPDGSISLTEDARHNQAGETIDQNKLIAQMDQWTQQNKLDAGKLDLSQAEFEHKVEYDQATLDKASAQLALDKDKTQLDALKSQLSGVDAQIRAMINNGQAVPPDLASARNNLVDQIGNLFKSAPKVQSTGSPSSPNVGGQIGQFQTWIDQGAKTAGVDPNVVYKIMMAESGGNPNVENSSAGAIGLMQFMPDTAKGLGINPKDPQQAITGAIKYMKDLLNMWGGDYRKAVASYNWGEGNVQRAISRYGNNWEIALPTETRNYLKSVLGR
jgi:soluble lytic murein transglycosylase-like protein